MWVVRNKCILLLYEPFDSKRMIFMATLDLCLKNLLQMHEIQNPVSSPIESLVLKAHFPLQSSTSNDLPKMKSVTYILDEENPYPFLRR